MKYFISAIAAATVLATTAVHADELVKEVAGFEIYRGADMAGGCYMTTIYDDGSLIQLGFDLKEDAAFLSVFNESFNEVVDGDTYPISIKLDGTEYTADAHGMRADELGGVLVLIEDEDFIVSVAQAKTLAMSDVNQEVARLDLDGSRAAVLATIDCLPQ